ncbi:protein anon-37Cs-like [Cotesia glomerata]|uniref:protein anon-37Cs-like n=1 Tax=Cotesia glomerata TaxID=32391 RepID=UPI001D023A30|nr:protein anon-37Cs-like [Cotesia glomerata]
MAARLLVLLHLITHVLTAEEMSPKIVIIGAGASGVAAASRLLQNGFNNITILEAENRIGGRVCSIKIGEYLVDIGGEWVVGEKNNVAFELASPLGLLERSADHKELSFVLKLFDSNGEEIPSEIFDPLIKYLQNEEDSVTENTTGSYGELAEKEINKYVKAHPEIPTSLYGPLMHFLNMLKMSEHGGATWNEVSAKGVRFYDNIPGDPVINWKERTYTTILDILMKKYPNPEEELPVKNITKFNTKVTEIKYEETPVKVITANKEEYLADHVIVTVSLGVLQKNIDTLFNPKLPEKKHNAIKNLSFGSTAKIILYYENPWWLNDPVHARGILWTEEDRKEIEDDPQKRWLLGISSGIRVEHKPKLLLFWVTGPYIREMETLPEEIFQEQVKEFMTRFFGKAYNLTEPKIIKRSFWNTNENFLGVYTFYGLQTDVSGPHTEDFVDPIMKSDKPVLQFAGEATTSHYGMVHGAIETGFREADRLINYYSKNN